MAGNPTGADEPEDHEAHPRLEGLADLVFGLALSIGAVFLIGSPPNTVPQLAGDVAEFGFSFLVLISVWLRYTRTMSVLRIEARWAVQLNIVLLFLVAIEPFLFNVAFTRATQNAASGFANLVTAVYAVNLGSLNACLAALTAVASRQLLVRARPSHSVRFREQSRIWVSLRASSFSLRCLGSTIGRS